MLFRAQIEPGLTVSIPKRSPYRALFKNKPKDALFWQSDEIKHPHKRVLRAVPTSREHWIVPEKEAAGTHPWTNYGHYMGQNFGAFWQTDRYSSPDFTVQNRNGKNQIVISGPAK